MGGFDVRLYASLYRSEVTGVVLVDSSHPDQRSRLPAGIGTTEGGAQREAEFLAYTMPFGIPRLVGLCDDDPVGRAADCNLHSAREVVAEMKALPESCSQATASGSLGDLPLVVLSRDPDRPSADLPRELAKPTSDAWEKMQGELAHLSTRGVQTVVKNSGHYIQIDQPEVVAETVHNVVNQARAEQAALAPKP